METASLITLQVRNEHDVVRARQRARQVADGLQFDVQGQTKFVTAVSEIVRNAFRYAGGGQVAFALLSNDQPAVEVTVSDRGPGIPDLSAVLNGTYHSVTGMGMGIVGARRLMDCFEIASTPGEGTRVRMVKFLPFRARDGYQEFLPSLARTLGASLPQDPLGEIERQNQELMRALAELRERQEELIQVNRELEDTNRGVVALHAELDAQSFALRRASQLKTRFLSHMTHEFRTPLNSIHALSDLLLQGTDGELNAEQAKQVSFIRRSCEQLSDLVNDLLDLAKVEAGKVAVRPEEFQVEDLFGGLKGALRPLVVQKGSVRLEFDAVQNLPPLYSDQGKIAQILRNLIANAFKFTNEGEVRVSATLLPDERVTIAVRDTGIGIAAEDQQRVFDEYSQVEKAQKGVAKGTGLGLPLSRRLAELLGGRLTLNSSPGVGSVFLLEIPMRYSGSAEMPIEREPKSATVEREKLTALIIDDDEVSRYLLRSMLPKSFQVFEAAAGSDGIGLIQRRRPQVVFLDLMMPDMTGDVVLEQLRKDPQTAEVPVVIYTAQDIGHDLRGKLSSAVAIISKRTTSREQASADILGALNQAGLTIPTGG